MGINWGTVGGAIGLAGGPAAPITVPLGYKLGQNYKHGGSLSSKQGLNLPGMPEYQKSQYEDLLSQRALAQGPSQQANYLMQQAGNQNQAALEGLQRGNMSMANSAIGRLGMGGMQSGSRERLLGNAQRQNALGSQSQYANFANQKLGILGQDEANKQNILQGLQTLYDKRWSDQMSALAGQNSAKSQYDTAMNTGGIFGSGGILGTGFRL